MDWPRHETAAGLTVWRDIEMFSFGDSNSVYSGLVVQRNCVFTACVFISFCHLGVAGTGNRQKSASQNDQYQVPYDLTRQTVGPFISEHHQRTTPMCLGRPEGLLSAARLPITFSPSPHKLDSGSPQTHHKANWHMASVHGLPTHILGRRHKKKSGYLCLSFSWGAFSTPHFRPSNRGPFLSVCAK